MHKKVLPKGSLALLEKLEIEKALQGWVLAGGTGLALHLGHRISEDFDFFRATPFSVNNLHDLFKRMGKYETLQEAEHTLTVIVKEIKISFFFVKDPFLFDSVPYRSMVIANPRDIALMKLAAISGRGSRKDFVDLYTILRSGLTLKDFFDLLPKKYGEGRTNSYHILKSLTYFADAEEEPLPKMLVPFNWQECKAFFVRQAHSIVLP
jgi:hypothetical protein